MQGSPVGPHDLIKDIMESAQKQKPPTPRYNSTWDVDKVLEYLKDQGPNASLELRDLTLKVTMLMSLVSAARGQELKVLYLENIYKEPDKVTFHIPERTKTGLKELIFHRYDVSGYLDVVACLEAYITATQGKREKMSEKQQCSSLSKAPMGLLQPLQ